MESSDLTLRQLMFSLIEVWKESGKTQREFCQEKDIAYSKFQYWMKKYSEQSSLGKDPGGLVPVVVNNEPKSSAVMELDFPDGRKLVFHQAGEGRYLQALLSF